MAGKKVTREQERREKANILKQQREAEARKRRIFWTAVAVAAVVAIGGIVYGAANRGSGLKQDTGTGQVLPQTVIGTTTTEAAVNTVTNTSGISGVVAYDTKGYPSPGTSDKGTLPHTHVEGPVVYSVTPPVGGDHNGVWMNCGVYTSPVPNERAVHNLEHGAIWITYRPSLAATDVAALKDLALKQSTISLQGVSSHFMTVSPWATEALPSPIVASAWGYQLQVTSATDPRLQQFIDAFRHKNGVTPEMAAPCNGEPVDVGGRPAYS